MDFGITYNLFQIYMLPLILLAYGIYYLYQKFQKPTVTTPTAPPASEYPQLPTAPAPAAAPPATPVVEQPPAAQPKPAVKPAAAAPKKPAAAPKPAAVQPPADPRPEPLTYAPIFDTIHQVLTRPNPLILGNSIRQMQNAGLPAVKGYKRCPTQVKAAGPWVSIYRGRTETVKGTKDLNDLANACDAKPSCLGFNSFLDDGYLHLTRDQKSEFLNRSTQRWVPVYVKDSKFKGCAPGTKFF